MSNFKPILAAAFLAAFSWAPLQAHAGMFDDEEARRAILELLGKVDSLRRDLHAEMENKVDKSGGLDLINQNEQLRQEIAKLRGQIEVLTNEVRSEERRGGKECRS